MNQNKMREKQQKIDNFAAIELILARVRACGVVVDEKLIPALTEKRRQQNHDRV